MNACLDAKGRYLLSRQKAVPILEGIMITLKELRDAAHSTPQSLKGKAVKYMSGHWKGLCGYIRDGRLVINKNWIENKIRPLAPGRKNYLFAGSHDAVKFLVCRYSIYAPVNRTSSMHLNIWNGCRGEYRHIRPRR